VITYYFFKYWDYELKKVLNALFIHTLVAPTIKEPLHVSTEVQPHLTCQTLTASRPLEVLLVLESRE